ncbi:MAG: hypothetical protein V4561_04460 [Bacteroidota bacterium]
MSNNTEFNEMNFSELKSYISSLTEFMKRFTFFILNALKRYRFIIVVSTVICISTSYYILNKKQPVWTLRMSCIYNDNHPRVFGEMLSQLNYLIEIGNFKELSTILDLDIDKIKVIKSIEGKNISLGKLDEDYSKNKDPFYIYVTLSDLSLKSLLEERLINYLNNNPYSLKLNIKQKEKWNSRIDFYQKQLLQIDSLKNVIRQSLLLQNTRIDLAQPNNSVVDIFKLSDSMSYFLADYIYYVNNYTSVEKLNGFSIIQSSNRGSHIKSAILITVFVECFLLLGLILFGLIKASK